MANRDLIDVSRNIHNSQVNELADRLEKAIEERDVQDRGAILYQLFSGVRDLITKAGKPTMKVRHIPSLSPPRSKDINDTFTEVYNDTRTLFDEHRLLTKSSALNFNYTVTERLRLRNKIQRIGEMVNAYVVTAKNTLSKTIFIRDTFVTKDNIDTKSVSNPAEVYTKEGFAALKVTGSVERTDGATIISLTSNHEEAMPSNMYVGYKDDVGRSKERDNILNNEEDKGQKWSFEASKDPHEDPLTMFDGREDTWFEYQMINFPEEHQLETGRTQGYNLTWSDGKKIYFGDKNKDNLKISMIIKLKEPTFGNMIILDPYIPAKSNLTYTIDYVGTSLNNSNDYRPAWNDEQSSKTYINGDSQTADLDVKDRMKYTGKGVWVFPSREFQYIKLDITCPEPYTETILHIYYTIDYEVHKTSGVLAWKKTEVSHHQIRVEGEKPDKNIITESTKKAKHYGLEGMAAGGILGLAATGGLVGLAIGLFAGFVTGTLFGSKEEVKNVQQVERNIDAYEDGWRWVIGIREVSVQSNKYASSGTLVTSNRILTKPARDISLSVSEFIPEEFYKNNIKTKNEWIKYYISVDNGSSWHRISPVEHSPVGFEGEVFPNKIISVAPDLTEEGMSVGKTYLSSEGEIRFIKLMVEFNRPEEFEDMTPILYDYEIRVLPSEVEEV